jgi:fructan beta-fructosidase
MSWGHATSDDLMFWKEQKVVLFEEDGIMIFSGSAVIDLENTSGFAPKNSKYPPYVLIYTGSSDKE